VALLIVEPNTNITIQPGGPYAITVNIESWKTNNNKTTGTFSCNNGGEQMNVAITIGGVSGTITGWSGTVSNVPSYQATGTITVTGTKAVTCNMYW